MMTCFKVLIAIYFKLFFHDVYDQHSPSQRLIMSSDISNNSIQTSNASEKILIIGASGQIGQILSQTLAKMHTVFNTDIQNAEYYLDACDSLAIESFVKDHKITQIYHLAAILSANGEKNPLRTWQINMQSLLNVLEIAKNNQLRVFYPSTIAVFGEHFNQYLTENDAPLFPSTVYGISKAAGENWCAYYRQKYQVDVRSLRYPGVIGWQSLPGGGTTDYAIDIFHQLIQTQSYTCFLSENRCLPMIYMDDAIRATIELMNAPVENIKLNIAYNLAGFSFTPAQLFKSIQENMQKRQPNQILKIDYQPDFRDQIAATWPFVIDDTLAYQQWGWQAKYDLNHMVDDMLNHLTLKIS
jgi:threonine 3-dehydrogenase